MWISTLNTGFSKLNLKTGIVTRYDPTNSNIKSPWALEILGANDGTVWIATNFQHGLNRFHPSTGKLKEYRNNPKNLSSISSNLITYLFEDRQNRIWIGAANAGLNLYNPAKDDFIRFTHNPSDKNSISSNEVYSMLQLSESEFWIGTQKGLNFFDLHNEKFTGYKPEEFISEILPNARRAFMRERATAPFKERGGWFGKDHSPTGQSSPAAKTGFKNSFHTRWQK